MCKGFASMTFFPFAFSSSAGIACFFRLPDQMQQHHCSQSVHVTAPSCFLRYQHAHHDFGRSLGNVRCAAQELSSMQRGMQLKCFPTNPDLRCNLHL